MENPAREGLPEVVQHSYHDWRENESDEREREKGKENDERENESDEGSRTRMKE